MASSDFIPEDLNICESCWSFLSNGSPLGFGYCFRKQYGYTRKNKTCDLYDYCGKYKVQLDEYLYALNNDKYLKENQYKQLDLF